MKERNLLQIFLFTFVFLLINCFLYAQEESEPDTLMFEYEFLEEWEEESEIDTLIFEEKFLEEEEEIIEEEFIIDNEDSLNYFEEGTWQYSNTQAYEPTSRYAYVNQHPKACAHFFITLPKSGVYELFEIVPATANASDHGVYVLSISNVVVDSLVLNQNVGSGNWVSLGRHYLPGGHKIEIKVVDTGEGTQGLVLRADAIKIALEEELIEVVIEEEIPEEIPIEEEVIEEEIPEEELIEEEIILEEPEEVPEEVVGEEPPEEQAVEEVIEEVSFIKPRWGYKLCLNFGIVEPWMATGGIFEMGAKGQLGAMLNPNYFMKLPLLFSNINFEAIIGYTKFNGKETTKPDASTSIISFALNGRYDLSDLIAEYIGFENPAIGFFGIAGFQYNLQSWDVPNREFDSASAFGMNLGIGIKLKAIDVRFVQSNFVMGDVKDHQGEALYYKKYNHAESGLLLGIVYPF